MTSARDPQVAAFLRALASSSVPLDVPLPSVAEIEAGARQVAESADRLARFEQSATKAGQRVTRTVEADLARQLGELVRAVAKRPDPTIVLADDVAALIGDDGAARLAGAASLAGGQILRDADDAELFAADVAITGVAAAIAETGSLVWSNGPGVRRGLTLAPPVHIAVVRAAEVCPDLIDGLRQARAALEHASNVLLITGPSKTADIEGVLVTGVHGPGRVEVLLVIPAS